MPQADVMIICRRDSVIRLLGQAHDKLGPLGIQWGLHDILQRVNVGTINWPAMGCTTIAA